MSQLANMMEQVKKLKTGVGVQSLLDSAYKILGNPIAMFNTEYKLLAYNEVVTDDPVWNELVTLGTFSKETQELFANEGFIEDVANARNTALLASDKLKYDRYSGKLFNKNNTFVSNLVIVACNKPFEEYDQMVFEAVCRIVSKEISQFDFFQEYEQDHQEVIINNLIDGTYDKKLDMAQIEIIYSSLQYNLYVAVVDISLSDLEYKNIRYLRDMLKQAKPEYKYAIYSNYIIVIISTNSDSISVCKELKELHDVCEQYNFYAGLSSRFENLFELNKYYNQALTALQFAVETRSSQRIFPCDESSREKMEQIKKLANGEGIQYFLNKGAKIFGNPLLFHDMELNLLGYTEDVEISDPVWQELITYGTSSHETIELFRTEGMIDLMDNIKGGALLVSDKFKYDRISWRIYNNDNIRIGCTSIVNTLKAFSEDELVLFGAFSQKFSKEVGKIEFYNNYGQVYSGTIINGLLSGKIDDYAFYSADVGNLYDSFLDNLFLVAIDTTQDGIEKYNLTYFRNLFNQSDTVNRYAIYSNYIIIIVSTGRVSLDKNYGFYRINEVFKLNNIFAGISSRFDNIYELKKHFHEAVSALEYGMKNTEQYEQTRIFQYDLICSEMPQLP